MKYKIIALLAIAILTLAACGRNTEDIPTGDTVLTFEGEAVFENELAFVAAIMGLNPEVEPDRGLAIEQLIEFMTVIHRAEQNGIGLTSAEHANILPNATQQVNQLNLDGIISDQRLVEFFAIGELITRLLNHYIAEYTPDLDYHRETFEAFSRANRNTLATIMVNYILTTDLNVMGIVFEHLLTQGPGQFPQFVADHSILYSEAAGVLTHPLTDILDAFALADNDLIMLFQLEAGEFSHIIHIEGGFYMLIHAVDRIEASPELLEAAFIEFYTMEMRGMTLDTLLDDWIAEADFTINN